MTEPERPVRAEHASLEEFLNGVLTPVERARVLVVSFSQWEMNCAAVAEIAATLHAMGQAPTVALWADETPVHDVGWTSSHSLARAFGSPTRDQRLGRALRAFGLPRGSLEAPPITPWTPRAGIPQPRGLTRSVLRELTYRGAPLGRALLQVHPDSNTPVADDHDWPEPWITASTESFAWAFDQVTELIERRRSTALVVFNGRFLHDGAAVAAAQQLGLPVLSYDFGGNDTDFDLTIDAMHDWSALQRRMLSLYGSWDPSERDNLGSSWFEDRRRHVDPRNALFVESQARGTGTVKPTGKRLIVFFSSSGDEISELDLDWSEYFQGQAGALMSLAAACRSMEDVSLLVRTHPHKRMKPRRDVEEWHAVVSEARPDVHLDEFSEVDSYRLMEQADVVVTYGSTTGVEAAYAKRPVIVMGPSAYDELGCATRVRTAEELRQALATQELGTWEGAVAYGLMMRRRGFNRRLVQSSAGRQSLAGVELTDSRPTVMKLSHLHVRRQRLRLLG